MDPVLWRIEEFAEIDSTNTWLKEQARRGAHAGLVARADYQSAGRGRMDRRWEAPPGSSLLASLLLRPDVAVEDVSLVVVLVSLSARAALVRLCGLRPQLKWPNDLVVGDAKLGGVLGEGVVDVAGARAAVVGIGVNLTWSGPPEVAATSVLDQTGVTLDPRAVLDLLLEEVEIRLPALGDGSLREEFAGALATIGRRVRVETTLGVVIGVAEGVDPAGRLLVRDDDGVHAYATGDVVHLRAAE